MNVLLYAIQFHCCVGSSLTLLSIPVHCMCVRVCTYVCVRVYVCVCADDSTARVPAESKLLRLP